MLLVVKKIVGIRPGEKIHEEMITSSDSMSSIDWGEYYAILPSDGTVHSIYERSGIPFKKFFAGFAYNSGTNQDFLSVDQLRDLIRRHVDSEFQPI